MWIKHFLSIGIVFLTLNDSMGQTAPDKYWVQFTDKENSDYSIGRPEQFLTQRSIDRKTRYNIAIDERDLPVNDIYISEVLQFDSIQLVHSSKWFNAITIHTSDSTILDSIASLPHVATIKRVQANSNPFQSTTTGRSIGQWPFQDRYGPSRTQINMINGHALHALGFTGQNMCIAVMDAGFNNADELEIFKKLRDERRIITTLDFVDMDEDVYDHSDHGTYVLSTMAGYMPDSLIGTAYNASYALYRTEASGSEHVIEEDNWVVAAEHADYLGADVLNTSLGYSIFDDTSKSYTYADMNGITSRISIAAGIAGEKGMLIVTSAGNAGDDAWHYITAPGDAFNTLTIGAVDGNGQHAHFSSFGPTADGRVKPNIMTMGEQTVIANMNGGIQQGNGTSFAAPILSGMAAALWQTHLDKTNFEVMTAIEESAHLYHHPNDSMGYGIPDFLIAHQLLSDPSVPQGDMEISVWPNPFTDRFSISFHAVNNNTVHIKIFDVRGNLICENIDVKTVDNYGLRSFEYIPPTLSPGIYILKLKTGNQESSIIIERAAASQ